MPTRRAPLRQRSLRLGGLETPSEKFLLRLGIAMLHLGVAWPRRSRDSPRRSRDSPRRSTTTPRPSYSSSFVLSSVNSRIC